MSRVGKGVDGWHVFGDVDDAYVTTLFRTLPWPLAVVIALLLSTPVKEQKTNRSVEVYVCGGLNYTRDY